MLRLIHASRSVAMKRPPVADLCFTAVPHGDVHATLNVAGSSETLQQMYRNTGPRIPKQAPENLITVNAIRLLIQQNMTV